MNYSSFLIAPSKEEEMTKQSYQSIKVENSDDREPGPAAEPFAVAKKNLAFKLAIGLACCSALVFVANLSRVSEADTNKKAIAIETRFKKNQELVAIAAEGGVNEKVSAPLLRDTACQDVPNWRDKYGDNCQWYEKNDSPGCPRYGGVFDGGQGTAQEGCCHCGGGTNTPTPPRALPTSAPTTPLTPVPTPPSAPTPILCPDKRTFTIALVNMGTNTEYDAAFNRAKARWESIIKCGLEDFSQKPPYKDDWFVGASSVPLGGSFVGDVLIGYEFKFIDGVGKKIGRASRIFDRPSGSGSALSGFMQFDEDDFARESDEDAELIILHEMGHILGLVNDGLSNKCQIPCTRGETIFGKPGCTKAVDEYEKLNLGLGPLKLFTKEPRPGSFTCVHWAETSFPKSTGSSELMTPFFEKDLAQPISRVSIAALEDSATDYVVDYSAADPYPFISGMEPGDVAFGVLRPTNTFTIDDDGEAYRTPLSNLSPSKKNPKSKKSKSPKTSKNI